jgi:hypothetical protein
MGVVGSRILPAAGRYGDLREEWEDAFEGDQRRAGREHCRREVIARLPEWPRD